MLEPESVQIQTEGTKAVNSSACRLAPLATVMWAKTSAVNANVTMCFGCFSN